MLSIRAVRFIIPLSLIELGVKYTELARWESLAQEINMLRGDSMVVDFC